MIRTLVILIIAVVYFLILYFVAFFSNRHYREEDDFLFISKDQWKAIAAMWLPILVALVKTFS
jgi:heme/copper-type cytochrome/quinol oxidase subunit 2